MNQAIIIGLLQNVAILLSSSLFYQNFWIKNENTKSLSSKILTGFILSGIVTILMFTPWTLLPGITFDTRSVMLCISGLFFGPIPTLIAMLTASIIRIIMGGDGMWMGLAVIITSGFIGLLWRKLRPNWKTNNYYLELLAMGFIVHLTMLSCTILMPPEKITQTYKIIVIPIIFIYIPATMLLGILMLRQYTNFQNSLAQLKLKESERRFTQILESGNIVSIIFNNDGSINFCNNYLLEITEYSQEEILEKNWLDLFVPKHLKEKIFTNGILTKSVSTNYENKILTKRGKPLYISWYNITLHSNSREILGIASIGVNITQIKKHEKKLKEKNIELQKAKEIADENNRLKSAFLANISHEIRTPMNAILGFSDLLKTPDLTEDKRLKFINVIENSGKRMLNTINDVIIISKIESGTIEINTTEKNLNEQIENIYILFKPEIEEKGIIFNFKNSLPSNQAIFLTDYAKIKIVLTKLLENAIKFTNKGSIEFGYQKEGQFLKFYVKDTGAGIPQEQKDVIFERFRQGSESLTRNYEGTGLGLSISKEFVEILGGKIWFESEYNEGSIFYFTVNLKNKKKKISS
ncbi:LytS/YhcK type 5TM receptor domain-containing protein [Lutibacter sp. B1]|uniref:LytS/YhcK type 5TM receptor domain-containing protein n=1 Tax=Lutibacter sp. B1 TaxID=2725996 RepID=UPI0014574419|nr:LytS/YhcK type 5TM receptor domain-containing protein [Lutibacter sp. B1]NLP58019.1 PAS domain S-box protein [Lutibacter sp. B1]